MTAVFILLCYLASIDSDLGVIEYLENMRLKKSSVSNVIGLSCLRKILPPTLLSTSTKKNFHRERVRAIKMRFLLIVGAKVKKT